MHDYAVSDSSPDDLVAFLTGAVQAGKIRYFGLGSGIENILRALQCQPQLCNILQFENSVLARNVEKLPPDGPQRLVVTHGSLSASYHSVSTFIKTHGELTRNWSTI